jgi:hypothetical protein
MTLGGFLGRQTHRAVGDDQGPDYTLVVSPRMATVEAGRGLARADHADLDRGRDLDPRASHEAFRGVGRAEVAAVQRPLGRVRRTCRSTTRFAAVGLERAWLRLARGCCPGAC